MSEPGRLSGSRELAARIERAECGLLRSGVAAARSRQPGAGHFAIDLAGCDVAVVTTQPGSKSQQNVQRQGFDLLYSRAVLGRLVRES